MPHDEYIPLAQQPVASGSSPLAGLFRFLQVVRLRKGVMICTLLVSGLLGALYFVTADRKYESSTELLVLQPPGAQVLDESDPSADAIEKKMPTFQKIIQSDTVLNDAMKGLPAEHQVDLVGDPIDWPDQLRSGLSVSAARKTDILDIAYRSKSPETAVEIVNRVINAYLEVMTRTNRSSRATDSNLIKQELDSFEAQIQAINQELEQSLTTTGLVGYGENEISLEHVQLTERNIALAAAQQRVIHARSFYESVDRALRNGEDILPLAMQASSGIAERIQVAELGFSPEDSQMIGNALQKLRDIDVALQEESKSYGQNHPKITRLRTDRQKTLQFLDERRKATSESMHRLMQTEIGPRLHSMAYQEYLAAYNHEQRLAQEVARLKQIDSDVTSQQRNIAYLRAKKGRLEQRFNELVSKLGEIELAQNDSFRTEILTEPRISRKPVSPKLTIVVLVCIILGSGSGFGVIYILDTLDDRFRSPDELRMHLQVPILAMVRQMEPTGSSGIDAIQTLAKPNGVETEAFRTLRTALSFTGSSTQRLVMSSTEPSDGKTTVLANLAVAFVQSGKRTLVIDADMRRPGMTTLLDLKGPAGLSQILRDSQPIADSAAANLHHMGLEGFDVIPSGPRPVNPAELLASDRFSELLAWAETLYDQILVDAPPVLAVADPTIVGRLVDGAILVVRPDQNHRRMVIRAAESFASIDINLVGVVVNRLTPESGDEYYGYGNGYGYGYGHDDAIVDSGDRSSADDHHGSIPMPDRVITRRAA